MIQQRYRTNHYANCLFGKPILNKMAKVSTYLNFPNKTEAAFNFDQSVFGGEFIGGISRFGEIPPSEGMPPIAEADKNLVMHIVLPILGGHQLMGTDAPESMGFKVNFGNNVYLNLEPDTRAETKRLFECFLQGGHPEVHHLNLECFYKYHQQPCYLLFVRGLE